MAVLAVPAPWLSNGDGWHQLRPADSEGSQCLLHGLVMETVPDSLCRGEDCEKTRMAVLAVPAPWLSNGDYKQMRGAESQCLLHGLIMETKVIKHLRPESQCLLHGLVMETRNGSGCSTVPAPWLNNGDLSHREVPAPWLSNGDQTTRTQCLLHGLVMETNYSRKETETVPAPWLSNGDVRVSSKCLLHGLVMETTHACVTVPAPWLSNGDKLQS
jgi:hypothetical protein